jgi:simple sugar transport system ATP-binding protein
VTFAVNEGEIHGLVGENGAAKTTLMKILFGMESAQEGEIYISQSKVKLANLLDAIGYGVGMVHQHFMLLKSLTIAENVVLTSIEL